MLELFSVGADCATTLASGPSGLSPTFSSLMSSNRFSALALVIWRNMASGRGSGRP